jgi:hypothetical protein
MLSILAFFKAGMSLNPFAEANPKAPLTLKPYPDWL